MVKLIETLQEELKNGSKLVTFTIVINKNHSAHIITRDAICEEVYVEEIQLF